jgi:tetratricopeptide (TPR) repeat protein
VQHAGYIWDDDVYVTRNPLLTAPDGLRRIWFSLDSPSQYVPLTYTVLRVERGLWGLHPAGYHAVNVLLHCLNAVLLWRLLRRLSIPGAWLGAALFALHPVNVESVAWITELKNILSLLFYLLAMRAWVEFIDDTSGRGNRLYLLTLLCAALAVFAKTTACTLPAALALILWLRGQPVDRKRLWQIAPFLALGAAMGTISVWWERHHQYAVGAAFAIGLTSRFLIATRALWFYAGKLIWPVHLAFSYPKWIIHPGDPAAWLWSAATLLLALAVWRTRFIFGRALAVTLLFYAAALSPLLGFIMEYTFRYTFVADHYQYIAAIAPCALAGAAAGKFWRRGPVGMVFLGATAIIALLLTLGLLTRRQCGIYADNETLWRATLAENPGAAIAHNNLAGALLARGNIDEAIVLSREVLEADPDNASAHNNLGYGLFSRGQLDQAIPHFQKALALNPAEPRAYYNLGLTGLDRHDFTNAIAWFQKAIARDPDFAEFWCNLAFALRQTGRAEEAIVADEKAVAINPEYALAHNDLGSLLLQTRRVNEALPHFQRAIELQPGFAEAQYNLAEAMLFLGRRDEAVAHYQMALKIRPNFPPAANRLAQLLRAPNPRP